MLPELQITPARTGCAASGLEPEFTKVHVCICIIKDRYPPININHER
jgi:hypothetical protein